MQLEKHNIMQMLETVYEHRKDKKWNGEEKDCDIENIYKAKGQQKEYDIVWLLETLKEQKNSERKQKEIMSWSQQENVEWF